MVISSAIPKFAKMEINISDNQTNNFGDNGDIRPDSYPE
jgi:hypothetical protein